MRRILVLSVLALGTTAALATTATAEPYPQNVRESFLGECTARATHAHCTCILTMLEQQVPLNTMLAGSLSDEQIDGYVKACIEQVPIAQGDWPPSLDAAFIEGCKADDKDETLCRCIHARVEKEIEFSAVVSGQADAAKIQGILDACIAEQQAPAADQAPAEQPQ